MSRAIIAILRGVTPDEVLPITNALVRAGITRIEVPLNSPNPYESISRMVANTPSDVIIGAGTVLDSNAVARLAAIGAGMIVSPDTNPDVIRTTKSHAMLSYPGCFSATECMTALRHGADGLKFFPAFKLGIDGFKALSAVLPDDTATYAVGGVGPEDFARWRDAGITGFGLGSHLYKPGYDVEMIGKLAADVVAAYDAAFG